MGRNAKPAQCDDRHGSLSNPKGSQEWNLKAIHRDREYRGYPVGRFGRPEDIANAVCYFAGVQAEHITGASLRIDGGAMLV